MNKALDLLREIRPSLPKEVLELWCKDRDAFLASHPAVEQAGGDERAAFDAYRDRRNAVLESEGHKPGSKWHVTNAHYPTWEASRAALAQPSPAQAEKAEVERTEGSADLLAIVREAVAGAYNEWKMISEAVTEIMEAHERIVGVLRAERDVALASRVAELELGIARIAGDFLPDNSGQAELALDEMRQALHELLAAAPSQAQHSVREEFIGRLSEFLAQRGTTGKALLRELRTMLATAGDK
ncbi:hypothetical protein [Pseudomonas sp. BDPW]|uniref:hypothetical protein n=1 Tax=Pseudomonas sp. BDPW TaxID=2806612 RepID=UPI00193BD46C|nr:hypothetical protein [Pseudomonas sp. BDPW]MBM2596511.1 hypothetical protein [Pseudomonas sp. BDPW]